MTRVTQWDLRPESADMSVPSSTTAFIRRERSVTPRVEMGGGGRGKVSTTRGQASMGGKRDWAPDMAKGRLSLAITAG